MAKRIETETSWMKLEDGTMKLVGVREFEVEGPTQEELIADKEAELLRMYTEIQNLKAQ